MEATAVRAQSRVEVSKQPTAKNASARILNTQMSKNVRRSAQCQGISAMVTATMRTTIAAASSMEVTAVRAQSRVDMSKQPTAKNVNARILNTRKTKNVRRSARIRTTSAMVTATMRTTIVAAISMEATAVVMSSKPTATSANARTQISSLVNVLENAVNRSTRGTGTVTMRTTIAAASSMEVTAVMAQSRVDMSKRPTAQNASARILNTQTITKKPVRTSAQRQGTSAMVSVTMRTTIAAVSSIKATAVMAQSRVDMSKQPTAKNASARILNTQTITKKPVRTSAQRQGISAMVSVTMRTTTVAVSSIKATVVVPMSSKPTAKNASANKRRTSTSNSRYCFMRGLQGMIP
jgi:hypothetical protein